MKRIPYLAAFFILIAMECYIAIYVHDTIIRPYVGDMLVVIVLYCFVRGIILERCKLLPLYIFLFAVIIEFLQYVQLAEWLGIEKNTWISIIIGSVFDIKDIVCYGLGCTILAGYEYYIRRYRGTL